MKIQNSKFKIQDLFSVALCLFTQIAFAQFAPQIGQTGTDAIYYTNTNFLGWATGGEVKRGFQQISDTTLGYTTGGAIESALGKARTNGLLSLGDGGKATLTFAKPITNGDGADFAVFENAFGGNTAQEGFLELAFVEASSNGIDFVRFPSISNTQTSIQTGPFEYLIASNIYNLAGKYILGYGTPFDLEELKDSSKININHITHVRVIDVVGSVDPLLGSEDSKGNMINDPFPTPFPSSGFDLDAIGVLHFDESTGIDESEFASNIYPNPCKLGDIIHLNIENVNSIKLLNLQGNEITKTENSNQISTSDLSSGLYILQIENNNSIITHKIQISY